MNTKKDDQPDGLLVVGIGASAGGLAVLKEFFQALPESPGMAFIVVQHLDPTHESSLSEILDRCTALPVRDAEDGRRIEANHVYVIPPNTYIGTKKNRLVLTKPDEARGERRAIDHFFRSLSESHMRRAVGIVFSGSGNDGTGGLRAIKALGGLALAQDPQSAEHPSMPRSAIETGAVDKVMDVQQMPGTLRQYADHTYVTKDEDGLPDREEQEETKDSLGEYVALLETHESFNLKQYKPSTVQRRITRRMSLTGVDKHEDYLKLLREDEEERRRLTKDLLINVTDFFRDKDAFEELNDSAIKEIVEHVAENEEIRMWIAGCATGEEAYSLVILVLEELKRVGKKNSVKVFATDIDEDAIKTARIGRYPMSIAGEVPKGWLREYFHRLDDHFYQIKQSVRDLVSFATQNVANDPPFNNMHLISCRNLLIYVKREVQEKILGAFYYSLLPNGYLFLGTSETASPREELFRPVSKKWRIYQQSGTGDQKKAVLEHLQGRGEPTRFKLTPRVHGETASRGDLVRRFILENCQPPTVVVGGDGEVLYNHGELAPFMDVPPGEPQFHLVKMMKPELRSRIRSAIFKARKDKQEVFFRSPVPVRNAEDKLIHFSVRVASPRHQGQLDENALIVTFEETLEDPPASRPPLFDRDQEKHAQNLELELAETKEELQNTVEELETSTEELKAAHEEALSTNEELQSSNEELEASSEELRSLNEELNTVNAQLKDKIDELQSAHNDVNNFFASTDIATIFLDTDSRIKRYTPAAEKLLKVGVTDLNRHFYSLGNDLVNDDLPQEVDDVLRSFTPSAKEVLTSGGRWFHRRVSPYRTEDRKVEGVVIVYQEITELKTLTWRAEAREKQQAAVARLGLAAMTISNPEDLMHQAVRQVAYILDVDYVKVLKSLPEEESLIVIAGVGWHDGVVGKEIVPASQDSQAGYTLSAAGPVIVDDISREKRFGAPTLLKEHRVTSGLSCRIESGDTSFGVLGAHTKDKREFSDDDANFLVSVANLLSNAIRRSETEYELSRSEENFRTMADNIAQLAWMTDETGYITWYNKRWYDYTGTTLADVEGWGWKKVHHPDHVDRVVKRVSECFETGEVWEDTFPLRRHDGEYRWFLSRALPIRDEKGNVQRWFGTNTDVTEQLNVEAALRENRQQLDMARKAAKLGIHDYDVRTGKITADSEMRKIWQLDPDEPFTIHDFEESLHPEDLEPVRQEVAKALDPKGEAAYYAQYRVVRKDGSTVWAEATGTVTFEGDEPVRLVGTIQDISQRKAAEEGLRRAVDKLEAADEKKNEFLAILGHELRNPLASIASSIYVLERTPDKAGELVRIMKSSVQTMQHLLDDLLDLNRVSQNRVAMDLQPVDLADVIKSIVRTAREFAKDKDQEITAEVSGKLPMRGDRVRLEQIFSNLLTNACRYTPEQGKIILKAQHRPEEQEILVRIQDNGVGLEEDMLERIFEPFVQVSGGSTTPAGLGIGLALSRQLVEKHGGKIKALSPGKDQGSTFEVRFQAMTGGKDTRQVYGEDESLEFPKDLKILIVEDNDELARTMTTLLKTCGCKMVHADCGEKGIQAAHSQKPDVMLVDIGLPDMSGYDVARALRKDGVKTLLIAHSGYSHETARRRSAEAGFDHHLAKPLDLKHFQSIIQSAQ
jgi:two-component system CheB/CheR fusion protein